MTMISIHAGAPRRRPPSILRTFLRWLAQARERRRSRKEIKELSRFSPQLLRDIGLERYADLRELTIQMLWH